METTVLYASVKNQFSRASLSRKLIAIVGATTDAIKQATQPPSNYETMKVEDADKLLAADPTLIQIAPNVADPKTKFVMATAAGIAAVKGAAPLVEPQRVKPVVPQGGFQVETVTVPLPAINRGGERNQVYPFEQLTVYPAPGSSFFVPNSDTMKDAGKTLASTVSTATRRYKSATPPRVFTIRANVHEKFLIDGSPDTNSPKGARIYRIAPPVPATPPAPATGAQAAPGFQAQA